MSNKNMNQKTETLQKGHIQGQNEGHFGQPVNGGRIEPTGSHPVRATAVTPPPVSPAPATGSDAPTASTATPPAAPVVNANKQ